MVRVKGTKRVNLYPPRLNWQSQLEGTRDSDWECHLRIGPVSRLNKIYKLRGVFIPLMTLIDRTGFGLQIYFACFQDILSM